MAEVHPTIKDNIIEKNEAEKKDFLLKTIYTLGLKGEDDPKNLSGIRKNKNENGQHKEIIEYSPFFQWDPKGWKAPILDIYRNQYTARADGSKSVKPQFELRLEKPIIKEDGTIIKYIRPRGVSAQPSFCELILSAFERGDKIKTLVITEGTKKAFLGCMYGAYVVAVPGVHNLKDKKSGKMHADILALIKKCGIERIVFLLDGDAPNISSKALEKGEDLTTRPKSFFSAVNTFRNLLIDEDLDLWLFIVDSDRMAADSGKSPEDLKGLDDIIYSLPEKRNEIIEALNNVQPSPFFVKFDVTHSTTKFFQYLGLHDVNSFFLQRSEKYPKLLTTEFKFDGGIYKWGEKEEKCIEVIPAVAYLLEHVKDDYYKTNFRPDKYGNKEEVQVTIKKSTIIDVYGRGILKHIKYYDGFAVVPEHKNYRKEILNHRNLYCPLPHLPSTEDFSLQELPAISKFLNHIAAGRKASYIDDKSGEKIEVSIFEMMLDYLQILYLKPEQKLPVLCLVSEENNTGKSTFAFLLRKIFGGNVAIVGNDDLAGNFNSHWVSKLIVVCDETMIEKRIVLEKIKSLSTATKVFMNAKGRDQVELDCFMKFVLITNNEENFIYASKEDIRYWIIKVPVLKELDIDILPKMEDEIPGFLAFLDKRKLLTQRKNRMHFHPNLLKTDALNRVVEYSQPAVEKDIRHYLREMFLDTGLQAIEMSQKAIHQEALGGKQNANYVEKILKKNMGLLPYHVWVYSSQEYPTKEEAFFFAKQKNPALDDAHILSLIQIKYKTKRYSYPKNIVDYSTGSATMKRIQVDDVGRPYIFRRKDFVSESEEVEPTEENKFLSQIFDGKNNIPTAEDEVPFPVYKN